MNRLTTLLLLLLGSSLYAQDAQKKAVLTQEQLLWLIDNYHPVASQGELLLSRGESTVRSARGGFDPLVYSYFNQKQFQDKNYYSLFEGGLKVPLWYGLEAKTGFDQNSGDFMNPEDNTPSGGLLYGGISISLGKGLLMDKRRATLRQAQIYAQSTYAEQQRLLNDLYYDALKQYWKWTKAWNQYLVYEDALVLVNTRFRAVKNSFRFGESPAIDTLEAAIQVQNRQLNRNQALLDYQNATLELSNFLWTENQTPLVITDSLRPPIFKEIESPEAIVEDTLDAFMQRLSTFHPDMQLYDYKLATMQMERRLKLEGLKPKLNLNYNLLNEPVGETPVSALSSQNYKWGFEFAFPILLRKERGSLQLTNIKIQDTELGQRQKLLELQNKMRSYFNEQSTLSQQVALFNVAVDNYTRLLAGERLKFQIGESSLFLVNSRETKLIEAQLKLMELQAKYRIAQTAIFWSSGSFAPIRQE